MMRPGEALTALRLEAQRRKVSYGQLVALTSRSEQEKIIKKYRQQKENQARRRKGDETP